MLKLILIRHGETNENRSGTIQGQSRGTLSDTGREQVRSLAERLKDETLDLILSSDLDRAVATTKIISRFHSCPVHYMEELRERSTGNFEGRSHNEYRKAVLTCKQPPECFRPLGGESILDLCRRIELVMNYLRNLETPATILISSHGGPINCLICKLTDRPIQDFWSIQQDNACVNILIVPDTGVVTTSVLNCTHHIAK